MVPSRGAMVDPATWEAVMRSIGGAFQIGGVATVAVAIRETRKELNRSGIFGRAKTWLKRFKRRDAVIRAAAIRGTVTVSDTVDAVLTRDWEGLDTDQRLDELKRRIERLEDKTAQGQQEMNRSQAEQTKALAQESSERIAADNKTATRIENLSGGNLRVETWGASLFLLGIALTTWAPELSRMLS